jgi:UDP-glucose 4-epimerase
MSTYLVTGGCGFIGSHLCDTLLEAGHHVVALDDLSSGRRENLRHQAGNSRLRIVIDSVLNRSTTAEIMAECDAVFHLAAAVGVRFVIESPVRAIETTFDATALVLDLANTLEKRVLITSSSEVYGRGPGQPYRESDDLMLGPPTVGRWSYACSKALGEFLAMAHARENGLAATVVRLFNTVGPRQTGHHGMVLPTFVHQALRDEAITVYGDGSQTRCFCDVREVAAALVRLIEHSGSVGEIFNIGSTEEVSIENLARRVVAMTGSASQIVHVPYDQAWDEHFEDMVRRVPDLSRAKDLIGFRPRKRLDEIIEQVVAHQRAAVLRESS